MERYKFVNFVWLSMDEVSDGLKAEIWIDAVKLDVYGYGIVMGNHLASQHFNYGFLNRLAIRNDKQYLFLRKIRKNLFLRNKILFIDPVVNKCLIIIPY